MTDDLVVRIAALAGRGGVEVGLAAEIVGDLGIRVAARPSAGDIERDRSGRYRGFTTVGHQPPPCMMLFIRSGVGGVAGGTAARGPGLALGAPP
jgi:hypothetical protein